MKPMFTGPSPLVCSALYRLNRTAQALRVLGLKKPANLDPKIRQLLLIILFFFCFRDFRAPFSGPGPVKLSRLSRPLYGPVISADLKSIVSFIKATRRFREVT